MSFYNTGNPVPSIDPRDLDDNAKKLDEAINSQEEIWVDRLGATRKSIKGVENGLAVMQEGFDAAQAERAFEFNVFLENSGYEIPVDYAAGISVTRLTQVIRFSGELYRAKDASLPFTTTVWATDSAKFFAAGDAVLRQDLSTAVPISVVQKGATGVGNETAIFIAACSEAVALGHRRVIISLPTFTVTDNTDCLGCEIIGAKTSLTGSLQNFSVMTGVNINSRNTDDRRVHPVARIDRSPKLIKYIDGTSIQVIVAKKSKGYVLIELKSNVTTSFDSLASGNTDVNTHRVVAVTNCVDAIVGYKTANAQTGTWTTPFLISGIEEAINGGIQYTYLQGQAGAAGIYHEMSIVVPQDGYFNVGFLRSSSACADVSVLVDGVTIDANFTTVEATATVEIRNYRAKPGVRLIRVVKNVGGGLLNLLGCNFSKLKNARNDVSISGSGYYRNSTNYKDYINSTSANGYAIRDKDAGVWGGEYHGGETSITERFLIDGNLSVLTAGQVAVCNSLVLRANFNIDYTSHVPAGVLLKCRKEHSFCLGGYNHSFSFAGPIRAESAFTTLVGVNPNFDLVLSPVITDLAAMPDSTRVYFGRQNGAVYGCSTSDQQLSITHSTFTNEDSEKGGAYIFKNLSPGNYVKYYYAPVDRGDRTFNDISALAVIDFS